MFVTKMAMPRRTVLRGIGATVALPFLDAMVPALSHPAHAAAPIMRVGMFYVPNGVYLPNFHPAGEGGTHFALSQSLQPLAPFRDRLVVLTGLSNRGVMSQNEGGGVHQRAHAGWLSGIKAKRTEGSDMELGKTIDQYAADLLGTDTPLRSLEMTTESTLEVGTCDNGYACAYQNSTSWRSATTPLPHERNPRVIFERLFGDGGSVSARLSEMQRERSLLDSVVGELRRLENRLSATDRRSVTEYLEAVRDVERRIQNIEARSQTELPEVVQPAGVPASYEEHVTLLLDLLLLAYQADITRVSCTQLSRESSQRTYPQIGVPESHHNMSHHQGLAHNIAQYTKINTYHVSLVARLVEKMSKTPDGDGTLLDHSILLHGAGMGDGDQHTPLNIPVALIGGACGKIRGGRHLKYAMDTPFMNLGVTLLDRIGVHVDKIADSTERLTDL